MGGAALTTESSRCIDGLTEYLGSRLLPTLGSQNTAVRHILAK